jgi:hypothetical protein
MSVYALLDHPLRRAARPGARRPARRETPTRASLIVDFLAICELDPAVESLRAPAPAALFRVGAAEIEHSADFEIVRDGAATLVDVLTDADLVDHPLRAALVGGGATAADGREFTVETFASLRAEPRFTTVRLIQACRRTFVSAGDRVRILHHLDECGTARLVEAASVAQNAADGVAAVLALACEGLVSVDISRPILPETPVKRRRLAFTDPFEF